MRLYALWSASGTLIVIWLFGVAGAWGAGPWIHVMLLTAIGLMATSLFSRPRTV